MIKYVNLTWNTWGFSINFARIFTIFPPFFTFYQKIQCAPKAREIFFTYFYKNSRIFYILNKDLDILTQIKVNVINSLDFWVFWVFYFNIFWIEHKKTYYIREWPKNTLGIREISANSRNTWGSRIYVSVIYYA